MDTSPPYKVRIWDLPTRLFHWLLALAAIGLLITGKIGGDVMVWHARLGYTVGALVLFRLVWGVTGGHWSRFANFPPSVSGAWRYWRGRGATALSGHNPLGALSVYAMLLFLLLQVASGLFSENKDDFYGPLTSLVSNDTVRLFTGYHKRIGQWVLIALVAAHLLAIGWYAWRGQNLVSAMVRGDKAVAQPTTPSRDDSASRLRALLWLALCSAAVWGLLQLGS